MNTNFALLLSIIGLAFSDAGNLRSSGRASSTTTTDSEQASRKLIINGDDARSDRYPWIVRYSYDNTLCGGSLIAPDLVLTAAHCFKNNQLLGEAQVGRYNLGSGSERFQGLDVTERFAHGRYRHGGRFNPANDIAILKLSGSVSGIDPVKLNFDAAFPSSANDELKMLGWGTSSSTVMAREDILQEAETHYVPFEQCAVARDPNSGYLYGYSTQRTVVGDDWLCTQNDDAASCKGDSGGPIITPRASSSEQDVLVGVISSSLGGCENQYLPQINQRISHHAEWIKEIGCEASSNPPAEWGCPGSVASPRIAEVEDISNARSEAPSMAPSTEDVSDAPSDAPSMAPSTAP